MTTDLNKLKQDLIVHSEYNIPNDSWDQLKTDNPDYADEIQKVHDTCRNIGSQNISPCIETIFKDVTSPGAPATPAPQNHPYFLNDDIKDRLKHYFKSKSAQDLSQLQNDYPSARDAIAASATCSEKVSEDDLNSCLSPQMIEVQHNISQARTKRDEAKVIVEGFLEFVKSRGITLTGDQKTDREKVSPLIDEFFSNPPIKAQNKPLWKVWDVAPANVDLAKAAIQKTFDVDRNTVIDYASAGILNGVWLILDIYSLIGIESDDWGIDFFGTLLALDLPGLTQDIGGTINMSEATFNLVGQLIYDPLTPKLIANLPKKDQPIVQNSLQLLALLQLFRNNLIQHDLLATQFGQHSMKNIPAMVEQLMRYLLSHGSNGRLLIAHQYSASLSKDYGTLQNISNLALRGTFVGLSIWTFYNNALVNMRANVTKAGQPGELYSDSEPRNKIFEGLVVGALPEGDAHQSFAAMSTAALLIADIITKTYVESIDLFDMDALKDTKAFAPLFAAALTTLGLGLGVSLGTKYNLKPIYGTDSIEQFLQDTGRHNNTVEDFEGAAQEWNATYAALIGSVENIAAFYTKHPEEVVRAFGYVNAMIGTNLALSRAGEEGNIALNDPDIFFNTDPYTAVTNAINAVSAYDIIASAWAGVEVGATAAKADGPYYGELLPFLAGLTIRGVFLEKAINEETGSPGHQAVINGEIASFCTYVGVSAIAFTYVLLRDGDDPLTMEFGSGEYKVSLGIKPGPGDAGIAGEIKFGSSDEEIITQLEQEERGISDEDLGFVRIKPSDESSKDKNLTRPKTDLDRATDAVILAQKKKAERPQEFQEVFNNQRNLFDSVQKLYEAQVKEISSLLRDSSHIKYDIQNSSHQNFVKAEILKILLKEKDKIKKTAQSSKSIMSRRETIEETLLKNEIEDLNHLNGTELAEKYKEICGQDLYITGMNHFYIQLRTELAMRAVSMQAVIAKFDKDFGQLLKGSKKNG